MTPQRFAPRLRRRWTPFALALVLATTACTERHPTTPEQTPGREHVPALAMLSCRADVGSQQVSCVSSRGPGTAGGMRPAIIGGQNVNVVLTSSNVSRVEGIFQFDVTVQNLLPEAIGTGDGVTLDPAGISVFFHSLPRVTEGSGNISVANADGRGMFTASNQPYFRYNQMLAQDEVSTARTWQLALDAGVTSFAFAVYVAAEVQPLLVINEVLTNPGGTISDANGEWFEVYNAGALVVEMEGMFIADSAASGRRPYHRISAPLRVPPGGHVVLGNTTNTINNGGVPVDYAYGSALAFTNALDALKISRVVGVDTLTIDRVKYSSFVSVQNGISRELRNLSLDNSNMDGSSWADAAPTSVYGPGGRGTPKAQNSTYTPQL